MIGEAGEAQGPPIAPPVKEGEQTTNEQLKALVEELTRQDEALGGNLLVKVPLSAEDPRDVLFFSASESRVNRHDAHMTYGVHPDKGTIGVLERQVGYADMPLSKGILNHRAGVSKWNGSLDRVVKDDQIGLVQDGSSFREWQQSYELSKRRAERITQEEAFKRQFVPKALEAVRGGSTRTATESLAEPPSTALA